MTLNEYFSRIFCINLARRPDRWRHVEEQCRRFNLRVERFEAHDRVVHHGQVNGNAGCTASHRALLELAAHHRWPRVLILEDDFEIRHDDFNERFSAMISEVPDDWDMLYLGGGYAEPPQYRHSEHVIRINAMLTTSSYAVTTELARRMAPYISGVGPIDSLYGHYNRTANCFIVQPRLIVQYPNVSDLQEQYTDNTGSMLDEHHEDMLLSGEWLPGPGGDLRRLESTLARRELAARTDIDGLDVIVGRELFRVVAIESLPNHPPPWWRGEPCVYVLAPCAAIQSVSCRSASREWQPEPSAF